MINLRDTGSSSRAGRWLLLLVIVLLTAMPIVIKQKDKRGRQKAIAMLLTTTQQQVTAFKVRPDTSSSYNDNKVIMFEPKERLVAEFFQAITDNLSYQPEHDTTSTQWGIQIHTQTRIITTWFYIPSDKSEIVVGNIESESVIACFQSRSLLRWYQKYGHYWKVGDYQKVQYNRVKQILTLISPEDITSFRIIPGVSESSTGKETNEFSQDVELVMKFFQALEDMQFAAPKYKELVDQWNIQIRTGTTTVNIECSIPTNDPILVVGLIDSDAGYSSFQSRKLFHWYQTYSHRWLEAGSKE